MGLRLCFLREVGALTFLPMAQCGASQWHPREGVHHSAGEHTAHGGAGAHWWYQLREGGRALLYPQNRTPPCQHGCLGAAETHLWCSWQFAMGSSANCLLPPAFPWISAQTGQVLLERAKPEAVMNTAWSTWSLFPHEGGERIDQRQPLL